jgi:hypothetical protein
MQRLVETVEVDAEPEGTAITLRRRLGRSAGAGTSGGGRRRER